MTAAGTLPLIVATPLLGAALLVAVGRRLPRVAAEALGCAFAAGTAALALSVLLRTPPATGHGTGGTGGAPGPPAVEWLGGWHPHGGAGVGIVLVGDRVGVGLAVLASLLVVAVLAYSWRYFDERPHRPAGTFPALVLIFQAGMCGFVLTGDLFNAFVFFELMGVVAYALTGYRVEEARAVQGALTFGIVNSLGGYATLLGIALLYGRTGELGLAQIGARLDARAGAGPGSGDALTRTGSALADEAAQRPGLLVLTAFVLVLTGLLIKAAAVPFHFWLPDAHAVAPTPVCMLLSGVMVELGVYGTARVYWTVFAGPGGIPAEDAHRALLALGALTAVTGAVMCWQQRHLKRLLAFSTVAHTGLFLVGIAVLTPQGVAGTAVYVLGHAGVKAALFACTGILLDRFSSVDEHALHGRGRELPLIGVLYGLGGLALAGLPLFATGLGKALTEEAAGVGPTVLFVAVSAVTGGAVLRAAARVFLGLGERSGSTPPYDASPQGNPPAGHPSAGNRPGRNSPDGNRRAADFPDGTSGAHEEPETRGPLNRIPDTMLAVPIALLAAVPVVGLVPELHAAIGRAADAFTDHAGYAAAVLGTRTTPVIPAPTPAPHWTVSGIALGLLSAALATALARWSLRPGARTDPARWTAPLRRLHSGHIGDYVACALAGITVTALVLLPALR
ncbi:complex I subunit 5 family protein [Streptomyces sp. MST-110588]|uniref:complex I subunit 5 family protein n=1 Tax=Streptomyces sp. MST-110588 TaxID=2833628 RepID=UPI001F5C328A|nr:complex I subunit 5 family protein [Streptomyces sp. MST-110588]UNO38829.1 NADH dehydrogenase [Streptomyces sp. MST-110588]